MNASHAASSMPAAPPRSVANPESDPVVEAERLADWFKLLGDPTRVRILYTVLEAEELCVSDIGEHIGVAESTVSHALRWLRRADVVRSRRVGKQVFYRLDDDHVRVLLDVGRRHLQHHRVAD